MSEPIDRLAGRPRDPELDARVVAAVRALLVESGWEGTTIRQVAERSGVSRPSIARRWPSKAHLVFEALLGSEPELERFDDTDARGWIDEVIDGSFELFDRPEMRSAVPGLLAALHDHDDLRAHIWDGFTGPATALVADDTDAVSAAQAVIVIAAGAALFAAAMVPGDRRARSMIRSVLRETLTPALVDVGIR
ncbi:MAG TPA: helix-turn-helix domain-containing protein [Microthrixaceae bacterium]|nr:helix-turn-helix domain-containing protein [Microthrixaceae bacterium]